MKLISGTLAPTLPLALATVLAACNYEGFDGTAYTDIDVTFRITDAEGNPAVNVGFERTCSSEPCSDGVSQICVTAEYGDGHRSYGWTPSQSDNPIVHQCRPFQTNEFGEATVRFQRFRSDPNTAVGELLTGVEVTLRMYDGMDFPVTVQSEDLPVLLQPNSHGNPVPNSTLSAEGTVVIPNDAYRSSFQAAAAEGI